MQLYIGVKHGRDVAAADDVKRARVPPPTAVACPRTQARLHREQRQHRPGILLRGPGIRGARGRSQEE
jgi:hypothetical protein